MLALARVSGRDAAPEVHFREGYRLALRGLPLLDINSAERLRALMKQMFDAIPRARIDAFGRYVERVRAGAATTPAEDREMAELTRTAVAAMPPGAQEDLRSIFGMALDLGRFDASRR